MLVWLGLGWSVLNVNATGGIHDKEFTMTMSAAMCSRVVVLSEVDESAAAAAGRVRGAQSAGGSSGVVGRISAGEV